ncbi:LysR family transcriptional regulator [Shewanella japonica]|uniref:LysR family transcriptional regulator n=1 Tax=Shewanella japonica TaxID=93973 RepID=A0ABM6JG33_9GAMM|nr:LysR family transcriptional regulator [Shewanella japonica]ARD20604.1 LysR family transcriptional regulator [Shewanella japonica]
MAKNLFQNLDLNLLHVFFILYQERNMRLTANRLFVTQPAISKSLQKLRHHFDEELFVKISTGLEPTSFADKLYKSASPIYQNLEIAINSANVFSPEALDDTLNIALSSFLLNSIGSKLYGIIHAAAPNCKVHMYKWSNDTLASIQQDQIHLGINYQVSQLPGEISETVIAQDTFKCYVRNGHPCKKNIITIPEAAEFDFATIIAADWNATRTFAQQVFEKYNLDYSIKFRSELPSAVIEAVSKTDMIVPLSGFLDMSLYPQLRAIKFKNKEKWLQQDIATYIHYKNRSSPLMNWLSHLIAQVFDESSQKSPAQ